MTQADRGNSEQKTDRGQVAASSGKLVEGKEAKAAIAASPGFTLELAEEWKILPGQVVGVTGCALRASPCTRPAWLGNPLLLHSILPVLDES